MVLNPFWLTPLWLVGLGTKRMGLSSAAYPHFHNVLVSLDASLTVASVILIFLDTALGFSWVVNGRFLVSFDLKKSDMGLVFSTRGSGSLENISTRTPSNCCKYLRIRG